MFNKGTDKFIEYIHEKEQTRAHRGALPFPLASSVGRRLKTPYRSEDSPEVSWSLEVRRVARIRMGCNFILRHLPLRHDDGLLHHTRVFAKTACVRLHGGMDSSTTSGGIASSPTVNSYIANLAPVDLLPAGSGPASGSKRARSCGLATWRSTMRTYADVTTGSIAVRTRSRMEAQIYASPTHTNLCIGPG